MKRIGRILFVAVVLGLLVRTFPAWAENPAGRIDYGMAYYPSAGGLVMHGGWSDATGWYPTNEMWVLAAGGWSQMASADAPAFAHHAMAYDSARNVLVMCGKDYTGPTPVYQLWEYNGAAWTRGPDVASSVDGDPEVAFDSARNVTVLYMADSPGAASGGTVSETWEYNGSAVTKMSTATQPLALGDGALLVYDAANGRTVLVGGPMDASWTVGDTQTWIYNGADWTQLGGTQPPDAALGGMAYDSVRQEVVLITTKGQTWGLTGAGWAQKQPATSPTPAENGLFVLAFDPARQVAAFFGGESPPWGPNTTYPNKTWEFNGVTWAEFGGTTPVTPTVHANLNAALQLTIPALDYNGTCLQAILNLYPNPLDGANIYWYTDITAIGAGQGCGADAASVNPATFQITIPYVEYSGGLYQILLTYYANPQPAGATHLYWMLDLASITPR